MANLENSAKTFIQDTDVIHRFAQGDENTVVQVEGGSVPSIRNLVGQWDERVNQDAGGVLVQAQQARDAAQLAAQNASSTIASFVRPDSSTGIALFPKSLLIHVKSSPLKLEEAFSGAFDTNGGTKYTTELQKLINYLRDYGGGQIICPPKVKILMGLNQLYTGIDIFAHDWTTEFIVSPDSFGWGFSINPFTGGSPDPADNQRNISLRGMRIRGQADIPVFSEHKHLLNFNAASWVLLEDVSLYGHIGDALYLGSSNSNGVERHNENIELNRVHIDGVNAENRNGVSVIDCTNLTIKKFVGKNCTRAGQPGTIDLEPNANAFSRVSHVLIDDADIDGGGGAGINYLLPSNNALTKPIQHLTARNVTIRNKETGFGQATNLVAGAVPHNSKWENISVYDCATPFILDSVRGAELNNVQVYRSTKQAQLGYLFGNFDIRIRGLRMYECGKAETNGLRIREIDGLLMDDAGFIDCGHATSGAGRAVYFANGSGKNITWTNSYVTSPTGKTTVNVGVETATYTLNQATCKDLNNNWIVTAAQQFVVGGTTIVGTVAPTTGTWAIGQKVYRSSVRGRPAGWECVIAGAVVAGTWSPLPFVGGTPRVTTANRPTLATMGVIANADWAGTVVYDIDLNKLIQWTGTVWTDMSGVTV